MNLAAVRVRAACLLLAALCCAAPVHAQETPADTPLFTPTAPPASMPGSVPAPQRAPAVRVTTTDNAALAERIDALRAEIEALRTTRQDRTDLETNNQRLTELNAQLRQEVEILALELQSLRAGATRRWLLQGAGLVLLGLLLGVLIKARPRRSAWN